jgi:hypothetical protein
VWAARVVRTGAEPARPEPISWRLAHAEEQLQDEPHLLDQVLVVVEPRLVAPQGGRRGASRAMWGTTDRRESRPDGRRHGAVGVAPGVAARSTADAGTDFSTIKSALGFAHAEIALLAHLIMLTPSPSVHDLPGVFHKAWHKERRWIEFLRPTGEREPVLGDVEGRDPDSAAARSHHHHARASCHSPLTARREG